MVLARAKDDAGGAANPMRVASMNTKDLEILRRWILEASQRLKPKAENPFYRPVFL